MDRDTLRSVQRPLKQLYREQPEAGSIVLEASGTLGEEGLSCSVHTGQALVDAGLHPSTGGDGTLACSGDMLLQALVACAGVTLAAVAINRSLSVSGSVHASGVLDVRGTLGLDPDAAVGFSSIKLSFELQTEASEQEVAQLIEATEKYCVVLQTLKSPLDIEVAASVQ
ncbi:OsmC family protein [Glutamicibacter mysorens]|uniref:OsmC family protein n=1 Tax=Glutamicibacter mysorens TaxID=257984 RepID=UPI0020C616D3|nr:OsmC family protein [Glutamicibacter mysorens]UTM47590.1 OsmC family protein [Glutamicibacter mysorens]